MQQTQISSPKYDRRVGFSFGAALNNSVLKLYLFIYLFVCRGETGGRFEYTGVNCLASGHTDGISLASV